VTGEVDAVQQRDAVGRQLHGRRVELVEIGEAVGARKHGGRPVDPDLDEPAASHRADLEPGAPVGERVRAGRVVEADPDQEPGVGGVAVVAVADLREVQLVPGVPGPAADRVALVAVLDGVAERVGGPADAPVEHPAGAVRVGHRRRVGPGGRLLAAVDAGEAVLVADLPVEMVAGLVA
jgi:hypothetical protein